MDVSVFSKMPKSNETLKRTAVKTLCWRATATTITIVSTYIISGSFEDAVKVGAVDIIFKLSGHFVYEKLWSYCSWGYKKEKDRELVVEDVEDVEDGVDNGMDEVDSCHLDDLEPIEVVSGGVEGLDRLEERVKADELVDIDLSSAKVTLSTT